VESPSRPVSSSFGRPWVVCVRGDVEQTSEWTSERRERSTIRSMETTVLVVFCRRIHANSWTRLYARPPPPVSATSAPARIYDRAAANGRYRKPLSSKSDDVLQRKPSTTDFLAYRAGCILGLTFCCQDDRAEAERCRCSFKLHLQGTGQLRYSWIFIRL